MSMAVREPCCLQYFNKFKEYKWRPVTWISIIIYHLGPTNIWNLVFPMLIWIFCSVFTWRGLLLSNLTLYLLCFFKGKLWWKVTLNLRPKFWKKKRKRKRNWDLHCLLFTFSATNTHGCILFVWYCMKLHWAAKSDAVRSHIPLKRSNHNEPSHPGKQTPSPWHCRANRQHQRYIRIE